MTLWHHLEQASEPPEPTPYEAAYTLPAEWHDSCPTCVGRGGAITTEYQGDPPQGGLVDFFEACQDCIGQELCPGCMQPLALSFDQSSFGEHEYQPMRVSWQSELYYLLSFNYEDAVSAMPFDGFTCLVCGWQYDHNRLYERDDYDYDEGDYDNYDEPTHDNYRW